MNKMFLGNTKKVMAAADEIVHRIKTESVDVLMAEYHCGHPLLMKAIRSKMSRYKWKKLRHTKLSQGGVKNRWVKGHKTWNAGHKGICAPGSEKGWFKKGFLPYNCKKIGETTIRRDKSGNRYRFIALPGPTAHRHKWIPYAHHIWEKTHGRPVPAGGLVIHLDNNSLNDNPVNLILADRKKNIELMRQNNPDWKQKAIISLKKTIKARRRRQMRELKAKRIELNILEKILLRARRQLLKDADDERAKENAFAEMYGRQVCFWMCNGCGTVFDSLPDGACPKCLSLVFEKIKCRRKLAV